MTISAEELVAALCGNLSEQAVRRLTGSLRDQSPATLRALATHAEIRITGDGNVVGGNNQVFVLKGEGLQELAGLLRAALEAGQALHQLPPPPGDFTGREDELRELLNAVKKGGVTISGLQGMGGIGKTALALVLAQRLTERYPDAQIYLDLRGASPAPLTAADAMQHVIRAYHPEAKLPEREPELKGLYLTVLHGQRAILLMDNAKDAAQVEPLIPPATCILLVTSRQHFTLPGLYAKNLEALPPPDARALLLIIAPHIGAEAGAIAKLCGYLPLALRLAASALAERIDLSPQDYARRLTNAQERLKLVDASLSLSYDLLSPELQQRFRALAVFPEAFDVKGAVAVWRVEPAPAQDALSLLVKYSLVEYNTVTLLYRLHDLVRLFVQAQSGNYEYDHSQRHLSMYCLATLEDARRAYMSGGERTLEALRSLDLALESIRAGQSWAADHVKDDDQAATLCFSYAHASTEFLNLRLSPRHLLRWWQSALAAARQLKNLRHEGIALGNLVVIHVDLGDPRAALRDGEQAIAIFRKFGDRRNESVALNNIGLAYQNLNEPRRAIELFEQSLAIDREFQDPRGEAAALANIGNCNLALKRPELAIRFHERALEIYTREGYRMGEARTLGDLGGDHYDLGEFKKALEDYEGQVHILKDLGDRFMCVNALLSLGTVNLRLGQTEPAIDHMKEALQLAQQVEYMRGECNALGNLGYAYMLSGQPSRAMEYYQKALLIDREIGDRRGEGRDLGNLGLAYAHLGETRRAIEYHEQDLVIARETGDRRGEGSALGNLGNAYYSLGEPHRAIEFCEQALAIDREIDDRRGEGTDLWNMSLALDNLGNRAQAIAQAEAALKIYEAIEDPRAEKVRSQLAEWGR